MKILITILTFISHILHSESTAVFPAEVTAFIGEEVRLRLEHPNINQTLCYATSPRATVNYTLFTTTDNKTEVYPRIQYWGAGANSGDCGIRIRNITVDDEGFWRLTSLQSDERKRVGAAKVIVIQSLKKDSARNFEINLGNNKTVELGPTESEYCQILAPGNVLKDHLVSGGCSLPIQKPMKQDSGNWSAKIGVRGKVEEVPTSIILNVEEEKLVSGWELLNNSNIEGIRMYCNLRYSNKRVTFCRFLRLSDRAGFHLSDGLGSGKYSYSGNGLRAGDCGMIIESPSNEDYGLWQCILGVGMDTYPMAAFMNLMKLNKSEPIDLKVQTFSRDRIMAVVGSKLIIMCQAEASLQYCWLRHPDGTFLFPLDANITAGYVYAGRGLQMGECGVTILAAKLTDSGHWECHMGAKQELVTTTSVKITEKSLATDENVVRSVGVGNLTLLCHSVPEGTNLAYCRFVRPDGFGFNVHENSSEPIVGRYTYYGEGLEKGECGLLLLTVQDEDFGSWTCAARLQGEATETSITITISLPDGSIASIGIGSAAALGLALICMLGMAISVQRRRRRRRQSAEEQAEAAPEEVEMMPV